MQASYDNLNLNDFSEVFYSSLAKKGRSFNTLKNYKTDLACFFSFIENSETRIDFSEIDAEMIRHYGDFLEIKYNSSNSRRRRIQHLRIFFDYLVENQIFSTNPVRMIPTSPKFIDKPRPASNVDINTLFSYLADEINKSVPESISELLHYRNLTMMILVYGAGLRVSDLAQMKVDQIFINDGDPKVLVYHPKKDPYSVPLPSIFKKVFTNYRRLLNKEKKDSQKVFKNLFFNANHFKILKGGLSPRGQEVIFEEIRKKLLIDITPKSLRQACIFKWLQMGNKDQVIKDWLGMAPSYSLIRYRNCASQFSYDNYFLEKVLKKI